MSDYTEDFVDPDNDGGSELVKNLRKQINERSKLLAEKEKELAALRAEKRNQDLKTLLADVPDRFHKLAQKEIEDPTPEAVAEFVKNYGDLWGHVEEELVDEREAAERQAIDRVNRASANGKKPKGMEVPTDRDLMNMSPAELDRYLSNLPAE